MWTFSTDFRFIPSNKFHENLSRGNRTDTCGQTDRPEEANSLFSLFVRKRLITRPNGKFWSKNKISLGKSGNMVGQQIQI
jgi:hypothetical protein